MPGRPAQLAAHLCSRLCAACAHALPTALRYSKKTQERETLRDEGIDGEKKQRCGRKRGVWGTKDEGEGDRGFREWRMGTET